jgi:hypothetical protein
VRPVGRGEGLRGRLRVGRGLRERVRLGTGLI